MKVKVFYFSRSYLKDHRWIYTIPEEINSLCKILDDYSKTKIQISHRYLRKKCVILKEKNKVYIYRIEDSGKIDSGKAKYYCLFGIFIDPEQYELFLNNLSFFMMIFYFLPNDCFSVSDEIKQEQVEFEFDIKNILNDKKYNGDRYLQFRMMLDAFLIEHSNWQELAIKEEENRDYSLEIKTNVCDTAESHMPKFFLHKKRR